MKSWFLIVRHEPIQAHFIENGVDIGPTEYPQEGFGITAFDDKTRAEEYCKLSGSHYEVVEVERKEKCQVNS